jgi:hypothetical protein
MEVAVKRKSFQGVVVLLEKSVVGGRAFSRG